MYLKSIKEWYGYDWVEKKVAVIVACATLNLVCVFKN